MKASHKMDGPWSPRQLSAVLAALAVTGGVVAAVTAVFATSTTHMALTVRPNTPDPIDPPGG